MRVWLLKLEEQVPIDDGYRPYRMGMLAEALIKRGHQVIWWCSDRNHLTGHCRYGSDTTVRASQNLEIEFLGSKFKYSKPVSPLRLLDSIYLTYKFKVLAKRKIAPDLIVCAMPTPGLANASASISLFFNVPLILDCRDFWPEILFNEMSGLKKLAAFPLLFIMQNNLRKACSTASSFVGITDFFLKHLICYSNRAPTDMDQVFPLGFDATINMDVDEMKEKSNKFWREKINIDLSTSEKKVVYFAGRLNRTVFNEINTVISAANCLKTMDSETLFVLCGSGQYESEIKKLAGRGENIIFPGEIETEHLCYLRHHSYLAIQPIENRIDYLNSLSNKFFEYISSGLPILTSLKGLTQKVIESHAIGYTYSTSDELANFIKMLNSDKAMRNGMSKRAKCLFEETYSADKVYTSFAEHCEKVVSLARN